MNNGQHVFHNPATSRLDSLVSSDLKCQILRPRRHFWVFSDVENPYVWGKENENNLRGGIIRTCFTAMRRKRITATWQENSLNDERSER